MRSDLGRTPLPDMITLQRGFDLPEQDRRPGRVPVVASTRVVGCHDEAKVQPPGVVIGRSGSLGGAQYMEQPFWPLNTTLWVKDFRGNDSGFVYYLLKSLDFSYLNAGSGVPTLNRNHMTSILVWAPDEDEQRRIARVLRTLDDKIESNRRVAETLEEIVAALFKARFVDFVDHDDLVESEIGLIPPGWGVASIYDFATVTYGRPFKSALFGGTDGVPLLRIRDLATHEPSIKTPEVRDDGRLVTAGDVVVGMDGEFRAHCWSGAGSWLNQRVCAFDPLAGTSRAFVLEAIKRPLAFFEATKSGTTVIHLGKRDIDTFRVVKPPDGVMDAFRDEADPVLAAAVAAQQESRTLATLRDALLPKLISGEVRVPPDAFEDAEATL